MYKQKLMIVCNEKTREYGIYLTQLIGLKDDTDDEIVGLEDGSVDAVLWMEKEYEGNRVTLPSSAYVLFIGDSKMMRMEAANMETKFERFGMRFQSLGTHAVLSIDKKAMEKEEYRAFLDLCREYGKSFSDKDAPDKTDEDAPNVIIDSVKRTAAAANPLQTVTLIGAKTGLRKAKEGIGRLMDDPRPSAREINRQRYNFLTLYSYLQMLPDFMKG